MLYRGIFYFLIFFIVFYYIIHTVLQCDLSPLRPHCGEAPDRESNPGGPEAGTLPLDHHTSLLQKLQGDFLQLTSGTSARRGYISSQLTFIH